MISVHRMCSERDESTLLPVWTGESAMSKQSCLFGLIEHTHTHQTTHTKPHTLCVSGEQVAQRVPVAAQRLCASSRYAEGSLL